MDLQPEMRDMLMRNGLQAHVALDDAGYRLIVQGHDSPLLVYPITERQMLALTDWGTNTANKKAYNVLTSIVGKDFYMPKNFVHARNANGRVAMGLHGYRIGSGEYGRVGMPMRPFHPICHGFLGWTPRQQGGFHLRRIGGDLYYPGAPIVPNRPDGRMKPGELQSGGYGFYYKYKAGQPVQPAQQADVLQNLQTVITPLVSRPRSTEPARTYKELISSPVYFSNEKWQECLASHGLIVDKEARTLTVQSEKVTADLVYDLTEEETAVLTSNSIEEQPVEKRLEVLNGVIGADFADKVTMADLDSKQRIALGLHPEVQEELTQRQQQEQEILSPLENQLRQEMPYGAAASVDGRDISVLDERKGWYREERHGREVEVGEIAVHPSPIEGKYKMTAVIDGQVISHEISQKDYDKFLAVDDYHRMKIFSKIFSEVDMKMRPEAQRGLGVKIFAALAAGTVVTAGVVHGLRHHHHGPEFYGERFGGEPRPYFKPGVDTPRDVAIRNFEAQMNQDINDMRRGR